MAEKQVYKWVLHWFITMSLSEKRVHGMETHRLSSKIVPGAVISKEGRADSLIGRKRTHHLKKCNCKQCFLLPNAQTGLMSRVFANDPGDRGSIPGQVIPKLKKWYLIPPCLTLSIIRYGSRVKWNNPEKRQALSLTPRCSSY